MAVLSGWPDYATFRSSIEKAPILLSSIKTLAKRTRTYAGQYDDWWSDVEKAIASVDSAKAYCIKYGIDFFEMTPWYRDEQHSYDNSKKLLDGKSAGGYTKDNFIRLAISAAPMLAGVLTSFVDTRAVIEAFGDDTLKAIEADKEPVDGTVLEEMVNGIWSSMKAVHRTMRDSVSMADAMVEKWY